MGKPIKVSNSRAKLWRKCHRAHHYRYVEKLERKKVALPLVRGKALHEMIENRINGKDWMPVLEKYKKEYQKLFREEREEYGDLPGELYRLMRGYEKTYQSEKLKYLRVGKKRAEFEFEVPLIDGVIFVGLIDTVAEDKNGRIWLMEHKTHKTFPTETQRFNDLQTTLYTWVMPQIGFPKPDGVLWDYIRTKAPTIPEPLKKGGLSKKQIDTDYDTYYDAIIQNGLDPEDYEDILERLEGQEEKFYKRIFLPAPKPIVKTVMEDFVQTCQEIKILGEVSKARNITKDCSWCSYFSLCQAEMRGLDSDFIRKTEYKPREEKKDGKKKTYEEGGDTE